VNIARSGVPEVPADLSREGTAAEAPSHLARPTEHAPHRRLAIRAGEAEVTLDELERYAVEVKETLDRLPWEAIRRTVDLLHRARSTDRQVFIMGNGGSAATASHMACDLGKSTVMPDRPRFRVMALTDNMALFSAYANDHGYASVFAEQLASFVRPGDIVIAISTSGNSPNVLKGIEVAREAGATTIGWTGCDGGQLARLVDVAVVVPNYCVEQIEDVHLLLQHLVATVLRRAIHEEATISPNGSACKLSGQQVADRSGAHRLEEGG
jgi:D-sedoheptulose 7-phosphate isomerase